MEIDSALTAIQTLRNELQDAKLAAANAQLKPLPGENVRNSVSPVTVNSSFVWKKKTVFIFSASAGEMCSGPGQHVQVGGLLHGPAPHLCSTRKRALHRSVLLRKQHWASVWPGEFETTAISDEYRKCVEYKTTSMPRVQKCSITPPWIFMKVTLSQLFSVHPTVFSLFFGVSDATALGKC